MDNKTSIDRSILIPIGIGFISILGICLALLIVYLDKPKALDSIDQTATPFKYLLLATETLIPSPQMETDIPGGIFVSTNIPPLEVTQLEKSFSTAVTPAENTPAMSVLDPTRSSTNTAESNNLPDSTSTSNTVTATSTVDATLLLVAGKYDDTDSRIEYDGDWVNELFVDRAYQETLFVSPTIDNTATFAFIGRQLELGYFGDADLGVVVIKIDNNEYRLNQSSGINWSSPQLPYGQHSVVITHSSGDLVFLDYISILGSG